MLRRVCTLALASLACLVTGAQSAGASSTDICESAEFQALAPVALGSGPVLVRSLIKGTQVCIEFELSSSVASPEWFAAGPASEAAMVNSPVTNVMIFRKSIGKPVSHLLGGYSSSQVKEEKDQSFFSIHKTSTTPLKFSYQRTLAASSPNDVVIDPTKPAQFLWAYGSSWPISGHKAGTKGTATYNFATGGSAAAATPFCDGKNCPAIVGGGAFVAMLVGGLLLSRVLRSTAIGHAMLHKTLATPPVKSTTNAPVASPIVMVLQNLADLKLGETLVMLIFIGALAALIVLNDSSSPQVTSGQAALLIMMFMVLPITKIPLWTISFGSSFERIVKFHRWLGMALAIATIVHLIISLDVVNVLSTDKYGTVYPLWGFLAFLSFMLIGVTANEYMRRMFFDVFYVSHRVLSIAGFVFTILHSAKMIGVAMAVPLALYVIGVVNTWFKSYSRTYQASVTAHAETNSTTITLVATEKTKKFAQQMDLCSYFWVRIPTISGFEWHPFSAIVTPNGDSIGFCIRAMGSSDAKTKTFSRALLEQAQSTSSMALNLCGPFGKLAVDVEKYDVVVLIGGGVGVTPLLSAINQRHRVVKRKDAKAADWNIVWSVQNGQDLLMVDSLLPTQSQLQERAVTTNVQDAYHAATPALTVAWFPHCSKEKHDGAVVRANGEEFAYRGGKPVLDEYINTGRYMGRKVAVLACGPPTMVAEAQALARNCGFDFHKEVFNW